MSPKQSRHQMSNDQLRHLKRFFTEHATKKWNNHKKQGDLRDLLLKTGLSREQVYTYCRNKKHRDKLRRESRRDSLFKGDQFSASLENFGQNCSVGTPFGVTQTSGFNLSSWEQENTLQQQSMIQVKDCVDGLPTGKTTNCNHLNLMLFATKSDDDTKVDETINRQCFNPLENHQCACLPLPKSISFGDFILN
mmetsp:Transcript_24837/g.28356  ORF Transcript_24837/g.28356 Transcript_24837/m.28356 type:complete len:193 (-) Transcript_24837:12-590(-)|eukprot:CAMPEP_0114973248 /NCGR_PEP_ID=MMETSP0216-20121206/851_1 /TAXON_ID=223996 /ORGANISM="Protocruzia adherens, Strain Boccale" /LENGTH=192 /DNA_ID=CAMNT_0002333723 /DNA_START=1277 /DNA_END=1855 /DNA_ORIENTATION=-